MEIRLSAAQLAVQERFGQLFDAELAPSIRRMGEQPRTGDPGELQALRQMLWSALTDLGATRLLLPERHGGEAAGQQGAVALAELLGGALFQGPLLDTMTVAEALAAAEALAGNGALTAAEALAGNGASAGDRANGDGANGKLLGRIAEGAHVVLAFREHGADGAALPAPMTLSGDRVSARRRFVSFARDAECLCVIGTQDGRPVGVLTAADHPTVSMRRQPDTGRGELYDVTLDGTPVLTTLAGFADAWPRLLSTARLRHAAYLVGMCQAALELAVDRANTRRQFGQPIGRFQAPAFAMAAAATRVEAARWLVRATAWEADQGADVRLGSAQALAMAADLSRTVISTALQVHGAYGTTEEADIQLYFRRAAVERAWWGSPRALRAEVLPLLLADRRAARPQPS